MTAPGPKQTRRAEIRRLWKLAWGYPGAGQGYAIGAALVVLGVALLVAGGQNAGRGLFPLGAGVAVWLIVLAQSINGDGNYGRGSGQSPAPPEATAKAENSPVDKRRRAAMRRLQLEMLPFLIVGPVLFYGATQVSSRPLAVTMAVTGLAISLAGAVFVVRTKRAIDRRYPRKDVNG